MASELQTSLPAAGETIAIIKTSLGDMKAKFFSNEIPEGSKNFIELAKQGKYKNVPFHRIIEGFVIQGGDFTAFNGTGGHSHKGEGTNIGDEYHDDLTHIRGALSWAKTAAPNSIGSQFFIVHPEGGAHFLDHPKGGGPAEGYTVFGQVYEGQEVIDKIVAVPTDRNDAPYDDVTLIDVEITEA